MYFILLCNIVALTQRHEKETIPAPSPSSSSSHCIHKQPVEILWAVTYPQAQVWMCIKGPVLCSFCGLISKCTVAPTESNTKLPSPNIQMRWAPWGKSIVSGLTGWISRIPWVGRLDQGKLWCVSWKHTFLPQKYAPSPNQFSSVDVPTTGKCISITNLEPALVDLQISALMHCVLEIE